jgi:hypothetical protein
MLHEQHYNKNKTYYHGSHIDGLTKLEPQPIRDALSKVTYVTKDPYYALKYFVKDNGFLYVCRLTRSIEVFNGHSKIDVARLERKVGTISSLERKTIVENDWSLFDAFEASPHYFRKGTIIDAIASIGYYDGFYNNEDVRNVTVDKYEGIGLFVNNAIKIVAKYDKETAYEMFPKIKKEIEDAHFAQMLKEYELYCGITEEDKKYFNEHRGNRFNESEYWKSIKEREFRKTNKKWPTLNEFEQIYMKTHKDD